MATIFVDESGHTGPDLLHPPQPVFALASHDLSEAESKSLTREFFGFSKAKSLKYSQLARRPRSRVAVLSFLKTVKEQYATRFKTFVLHKPFGLLCKLVDHVVEVSMRLSGTDLYHQGGNLALSNILYLTTKTVAGDDYLTELLRAVYELFEDSDKAAAAGKLVHILDRKTGLTFGPLQEDALGELLRFPQYALLDLGTRGIARLDKSDLLVAFPGALALMSDWSSAHGPDLDVLHDQSSQMLRQFEDWARITSATVPNVLVGMDRRTIQYPIGVKSTRFERDEDWVGIQIADIVAGALAKALARAGGLADYPTNDFETELVEVFADWMLTNSVWPEAKFTPEELGTVGPKFADPFEFHSKMLRK